MNNSRNNNSAELNDANAMHQNNLREALTSTTDPVKAIESFQQQNGIQVASLGPSLPLLDLHNVPRLDFHSSLMAHMRDFLMARINDLGQVPAAEREMKLSELLVNSFRYIKILYLRPVVMLVLRHTPQIEEKYLKVLMQDPELYADTDLSVKRQIWCYNQSLFSDEMSPLLSQYIREKERILFDHADRTQKFFAPAPKVRRQSAVVQKMVEMIGSNPRLYGMLLQFLQTLFLRTRKAHYCTLRVELLMVYHDTEVQEILKNDPSHKFIWCLDACIRVKLLNAQRSLELQGILNGIRHNQKHMLLDFALALCDPHAINFLATLSIKTMHRLINIEGLPRDSHILGLLLRLLTLGLNAWNILESKRYVEPKLESRLITLFVSQLMSLMVDDQTRLVEAQMPDSLERGPMQCREVNTSALNVVATYIKKCSVASMLLMYYTLYTARTKDIVALSRNLTLLSICKDQRAYEDTFLHTLIDQHIVLSKEFSREDFCFVFFDEFLFAGDKSRLVFAAWHLLKLLWYIHKKLPAGRLTSLMDSMEPAKARNEQIQKLYEALQLRIGIDVLANKSKPKPAEQQPHTGMGSVHKSIKKLKLN